VQIDGRQALDKKCHLWKKLENRGGAAARATAKIKTSAVAEVYPRG